jgi:hypothetical protein
MSSPAIKNKISALILQASTLSDQHFEKFLAQFYVRKFIVRIRNQTLKPKSARTINGPSSKKLTLGAQRAPDIIFHCQTSAYVKERAYINCANSLVA